MHAIAAAHVHMVHVGRRLRKNAGGRRSCRRAPPNSAAARPCARSERRARSAAARAASQRVARGGLRGGVLRQAFAEEQRGRPHREEKGARGLRARAELRVRNGLRRPAEWCL